MSNHRGRQIMVGGQTLQLFNVGGITGFALGFTTMGQFQSLKKNLFQLTRRVDVEFFPSEMVDFFLQSN